MGKFNVTDTEFPESLVNKKISGFENATNDLASLYISKIPKSAFLTSNVVGDFRFRLTLQ